MFEKSKLLLILTCLIGILFPLDTSAQGPDDSKGKITVHAIIAGIILILTGIIFCFFGRRVYRLTLFLIGFYIGAIITWIAFTNGGGTSDSAKLTIALIVSLAVGFVVGLFFMLCSTVAIWFLGALAGYVLAMFILSWASGGVIHSKAGRIIFIVILTVLGLLLACFFKNTLIIVGTALIGAYAIILGVDMFARTGFAQSVGAFMDGNHDTNYETNRDVYIMLAAMVVLFIIGTLFQYRYYKNHHFGPGDGSVLPEGKRGRRFWRR